jgi:hypothetical protein
MSKADQKSGNEAAGLMREQIEAMSSEELAERIALNQLRIEALVMERAAFHARRLEVMCAVLESEGGTLH